MGTWGGRNTATREQPSNHVGRRGIPDLCSPDGLVRRPLPQHEPVEALLPGLRRLLQVRQPQGRGLPGLQDFLPHIPLPVPERVDRQVGRAARGQQVPGQARADSACSCGGFSEGRGGGNNCAVIRKEKKKPLQFTRKKKKKKKKKKS